MKTVLAKFTAIAVLSCTLAAKAEVVKIATGEYPPWTSKSLEHGGLINRIVSKAFESEGYSVEFEYLPWKRALEATKLGRYHASSFWSYKAERNNVFLHSDPVEQTGFVFLHHRDTVVPDWKRLIELQGFVFGATRGYTYTPEFWELQRKNIFRVAIEDDDVSNLQKLINKEIQLFPIQAFTGRYLLKKHFNIDSVKLINHHPTPMAMQTDHLLFSRNIDNAERLAAIFNKALAKLKAEGTDLRFKQEILK